MGAFSRSQLILAMNTLRVSNRLPVLIVDPVVNAVALVPMLLRGHAAGEWNLPSSVLPPNER